MADVVFGRIGYAPSAVPVPGLAFVHELDPLGSMLLDHGQVEEPHQWVEREAKGRSMTALIGCRRNLSHAVDLKQPAYGLSNSGSTCLVTLGARRRPLAL